MQCTFHQTNAKPQISTANLFSKSTYPPAIKSNKRRLTIGDVSTLIITQPKTSEELQSSWYTKNEIRKLKRNAHKTSQLLKETHTAKAMKLIAHSIQSHSSQPNIHIHRREVISGIEHLLNAQVRKTLLSKRRLAISQVLEEQRHCQENSVDEDRSVERIAQVATMSSTFAKEWQLRITKLQDPVV
eukprot:scaffold1442_cov212-Alexandrium_tamarense.AAC.1